MQAVARGETGGEEGFSRELTGEATGAEITAGVVEISGTAGAFESSFFHIKHLDIEMEFSKPPITGLIGSRDSEE